MRIKSITQEQFDLALSATEVTLAPDGTLSSLATLSTGSIMDSIRAAGLIFPQTLIEQARIALLSGKHLLLTGAPGTGKTELAMALSQAAVGCGVARSVLQTTGSSDWSPADTVGSYRLDPEGGLEFSPGHILEAIDNQAWLIIDELNRADIDKAIGPLFTVLSGQSTLLRYQERSDAGSGRVVVLPAGGAAPPGTRAYVVPEGWRLIATMNTDDRDLLYEMSHAFSRRFARLDVPAPATSAHLSLLEAHATPDPELNTLINRLANLPGTALGPAITLDAARYASLRLTSDPETSAKTVMAEVISMFIEPQLGYLAHRQRERVLAFLSSPLEVAQETSSVDSTQVTSAGERKDGAEESLTSDLPSETDSLPVIVEALPMHLGGVDAGHPRLEVDRDGTA